MIDFQLSTGQDESNNVAMMAKLDGFLCILSSNFDHWDIAWCSSDLNSDGPIATDMFVVRMRCDPFLSKIIII